MLKKPVNRNTRLITGIWIGTSVLFIAAWLLAPKWIPTGYGNPFEALSALFSGLAFAGLIATIFLQRQDLQLQTEELAKTNEQLEIQAKALEAQAEALVKQNFESTFFHMVQLHHGIVDGMRRNDGNGRERVGRAVFELLYQEFRERSHNAKNSAEFRVAINQSIRSNRSMTGHYVSNFYCTLEFSDSAKVNNELYIRIIKAQLSTVELIILFYCTFFDTAEWQELACKYRLFDSIDPQKLLRPDDELREYRTICSQYN